MNKCLVLFLLLLTSCAHTPMLEAGFCYKATLNDTENPGSLHDLITFKVVRIFKYKGDQEYAIQVMDDFGDAVYPGAHSYGYSDVESFDKYISPVVGKFSFAEPKGHTVQCDPISRDDTGRVNRDALIGTRRSK